MAYWGCGEVDRVVCECCGNNFPPEEVVSDDGMLTCVDCYFEMFCEEGKVNE
ncbi:hypothetical protein [Pseudomonas phage vB_PaeM_C2-10_Ab02]|uniref:Uncharacterized protein n=1 Tax=Pseudomonas phage vB_PaeM_C2-10_Ab02 TaxID=1548900 RepID=A0A0A1IUE5_9CAUD|nr:hypothetical protein FDJ38_gp140 [Pseudomonas phage vB_PaeM_C2-10_Ab02]CEF89016.1 hypothetical protein [Pseudomonas phage vB_PaeM_C2-10_Ab02]